MTIWKEAGGIVNSLYKTYVYKTLYRDLSKFVNRNLKDIDFDREYWLHKVGLTPYRPTKAAFGGMSLFVLGAIAGGVAGLLFAPKRGMELRTEVKDRARTLINRQEMGSSSSGVSEMPIRA
jgi:hypothetical protein